jgi:hypothetical protein
MVLWAIQPSLLSNSLHHPPTRGQARKDDDKEKMMFLLRSTLSRNLGGMGQAALYRHCHVGTKQVIEHYIDEVGVRGRAGGSVRRWLPYHFFFPTASSHSPVRPADRARLSTI